MRYPVRLEEVAERLWRAAVVDLPGCTAYGRTLEEALGAIHYALKRHLQQTLHAGRRPPRPSTVEYHVLRSSSPGAVWSVVAVELPGWHQEK